MLGSPMTAPMPTPPLHTDAFVFVRAIQTRHWLAMLAATDAAVGQVQRKAAERESASRHGERLELLHFLVATRTYLLSDGRLRPEGLDDIQFLLLRPLCEQLVAQGRFAYDCLALFTELPPPGTVLPIASRPRK